MKKLMRFNKGKTEWNMLDYDFIELMSKIMMFGLVKGYPRNNWKQPVKDIGDIDNSLMRHAIDSIKGEFLDEESGFPHVAHVAVNAMFKYYQIVKNDYHV